MARTKGASVLVIVLFFVGMDIFELLGNPSTTYTITCIITVRAVFLRGFLRKLSAVSFVLLGQGQKVKLLTGFIIAISAFSSNYAFS